MTETLQIILGSIILILFGIGIFYLLKKFVNYFKSSDSKISDSIITASVTAFVGICVVLITQNGIKKREIQEAHRESKIELYNRYNNFVFRVLAGYNDNTTGVIPKDQEIIDFMFEFKRDMVFRASPEVIKALLAYEIHAESGGKDILVYMDELLLAMRKDVGLDNKSLDNFELIQIFSSEKDKVKKLKKTY